MGSQYVDWPYEELCFCASVLLRDCHGVLPDALAVDLGVAGLGQDIL